MVEAILFLARTGCQWRYLPERYGTWTAVWAQWRRWRANGVWARALARLAVVVRLLHDRAPLPSMVMVDAQTVKGGRYGPTFHGAGGRGGRTIGTKRTLLVEILGLPLAARADSARPHDVSAARELLRDRLADLPSVRAIVGDRAYRGLAALAERKHLALDIKAPPPGVSGFVRSGRSTGSSTRSPNSVAGAACRAATRAPRRPPDPQPVPVRPLARPALGAPPGPAAARPRGPSADACRPSMPASPPRASRTGQATA